MSLLKTKNVVVFNVVL